jgi:hypothetical protein
LVGIKYGEEKLTKMMEMHQPGAGRAKEMSMLRNLSHPNGN